jgi:hypothetical protein
MWEKVRIEKTTLNPWVNTQPYGLKLKIKIYGFVW